MISTKGQDRYLAALELSWKTSSSRETLANFAEDVTAHTMSHISSLASPVFRVLGVGSGNGKTDLRILNSITTAMVSSQMKKPVIHTTIIEPSSDLIQEFKSSVTPLPQPLAVYSFIHGFICLSSVHYCEDIHNSSVLQCSTT
ncbi:hypothetical protein pdam_00016552 [Pocillopora damicornis]|uniref:Uncharacterized protein n=1 Tax=Pocillopora damicornis TaxID=46731 RepID=A0A3M6TFR4_POCDA|nr:hypothetical protein pdam_00016552 [Pocillopora damicornis]